MAFLSIKLKGCERSRTRILIPCALATAQLPSYHFHLRILTGRRRVDILSRDGSATASQEWFFAGDERCRRHAVAAPLRLSSPIWLIRLSRQSWWLAIDLLLLLARCLIRETLSDATFCHLPFTDVAFDAPCLLNLPKGLRDFYIVLIDLQLIAPHLLSMSWSWSLPETLSAQILQQLHVNLAAFGKLELEIPSLKSLTNA